jgi:hypothetical protein
LIYLKVSKRRAHGEKGTYGCSRSTKYLDKCLLHSSNFLIENVGILALGDTITEVVDVLWTLTLSNLSDPLLEKRDHHGSDVGVSDHLNTMTIGLNSGSITAGILVKRHGDSGHGSLRTTRSSVRDIGT